METKLKVVRTVYPNGDTTLYVNGMDKPKVLPSNDPKVVEMLYKRICLNK